MKRRPSLKNRLLLSVLGLITLAWVATTAKTYSDARDELDEILDAHLTQAAALLEAHESAEIPESKEADASYEIDTEHVPLLHKYSRRVAFQLWKDGTTLSLHSLNAPEEPLASLTPGFSNRKIEGHTWRVFTTWDSDNDMLIQVAERADTRVHLAREIAGHMLLPLLFTLPILAALLWLAISKAMRPVVALTEEVAQRAPDNLTLLDTGIAPAEVVPLIERLNSLFSRIRTSLDNERRFTADAAHELRTPIAAIKAQAQVARGAHDADSRTHALDNAIAGCDRATHLIEQLLTLARLDIATESAKESCDLRQIVREVMAELAPTALQKEIELVLEEGAEAHVQGLPALLRILLRNLIDNAIRHNPPGTRVTVLTESQAGRIALAISDNGPGIPEEDLGKLTERFFRPLGTSASGSGLGLSIVRRIADIHDAQLQLVSQPGTGLRVEILFR